MQRIAFVILLAAIPLAAQEVPSSSHSQVNGKLGLRQCQASFTVWADEQGGNSRVGKLTDAQAAWINGKMSQEYPGVCYVPPTGSALPDVDYMVHYGPQERTLSGNLSSVGVYRVGLSASTPFTTWIPMAPKTDAQLAALKFGVNYIYTRFACKATFGIARVSKKEVAGGQLTASQWEWLEAKERKKYPGVCFVYSVTESNWWFTPAEYMVMYGDSTFIETGTRTTVYIPDSGTTASAYSSSTGYDISFVTVLDNTKKNESPELYGGSGYARWRWQDASQKALEDAVRAICYKVSCQGK